MVKNNYRILVKFQVPQTRIAKMFNLTPQIDVESFTMRQSEEPTLLQIEEFAQENVENVTGDEFTVLDNRLMRRKRANQKKDIHPK